MKLKINLFLILILICFLLGSCAKSYHPINPGNIYFNTATVSDSINYATRFNVLTEGGNERYGKKEVKNGVKLVAVQIVNKTSRDIILRKDAKFSVAGKIVYPIEPAQLKNQLKQPAGLYMLWSLLWVVFSKCENDDCTSIPIPVGLFIGIGNTAKASKANKAFLEELERNNVLDKTIRPGESVTGLIGFAATSEVPLTIELSN